MARIFFDWRKPCIPYFSEKAVYTEHMYRCSGKQKNQSKNNKHKSCSSCQNNWMRTGSNPRHPPSTAFQIFGGSFKEVLRQCFNSTKIREIYLPNSMWPGSDPVKRVHVLLEARFKSLIYACFYILSWDIEILLDNSCHPFLNRFIVRVLLMTKGS